jgi:hypothetical protein
LAFAPGRDARELRRKRTGFMLLEKITAIEGELPTSGAEHRNSLSIE